MNNQIMQALQQLKSISNPQQMAINSLQKASQQGNPMAKSMLEKINAGDMNGAEEMLGNMMNEYGFGINDVRNLMK